MNVNTQNMASMLAFSDNAGAMGEIVLVTRAAGAGGRPLKPPPPSLHRNLALALQLRRAW